MQRTIEAVFSHARSTPLNKISLVLPGPQRDVLSLSAVQVDHFGQTWDCLKALDRSAIRLPACGTNAPMPNSVKRLQKREQPAIQSDRNAVSARTLATSAGPTGAAAEPQPLRM